MPKKELPKIKSGTWARGLSLARLAVTGGARAANYAAGSLFGQPSEGRLNDFLQAQAQALATELGQLKGSVMKVGQMLSVFGEHFLPPEVNNILKSLQQESIPLAWPAIERVLHHELSAERLAELDIETEAWACASLGQVHRARRKSDGMRLAVKIQYPGVDKAVDSDLRSLRTILSASRLLPKNLDYNTLFDEVRVMLNQEIDYTQELHATDAFRDLLANDARYVVPQTFPEYSTSRILTTSFETGVAIDSTDVAMLPAARRNALGDIALNLYFNELWRFGRVQTDPHFGNYRIRLDDAGDKLILLDFGAVREVPPDYLAAYEAMLRGALNRDRAQIIKGGIDVGVLQASDAPEQHQQFVDLCNLICEPFCDPTSPGVDTRFFDSEGNYDWGQSDLPKRAARAGANLALSFKLRPPPPAAIFLDRKLGGLFVFLSALKVRLRARRLVEPYLASQ